jgi:hypothetical protein
MITGLLLTSLLALAIWQPLAALSAFIPFNPRGSIAPRGGNCVALVPEVGAAKPWRNP